MARKVAFNGIAENDGEETAEVVVRVNPAQIAPEMRKRRVELPPEKPAAAILPIYLREMGATPLIREAQEVELARELQEARQGLAKIALRLPAACRNHCLDGDLEGPKRGREWPLDDVEAYYDKFLAYSREHKGEAKVAQLAKQSRGHMRHLNHARDALILANLRLVVHIAKKYLNHGISFMDLIQEGNIGLMKAVEKFEYERGNKFSTYAYWWIKQAIERAIADKGRVIRIPVHVNEKIKKISRISKELAETLGRKPNPAEIARKLSMPVSKVEEIMGVVPEPQALDDMSDDDSPGLMRFHRGPQRSLSAGADGGPRTAREGRGNPQGPHRPRGGDHPVAIRDRARHALHARGDRSRDEPVSRTGPADRGDGPEEGPAGAGQQGPAGVPCLSRPDRPGRNDTR